jgi:hypothetical protein
MSPPSCPAGLLGLALAGSPFDNWGIDTLVNYPPGRGRLTVPVQAGDMGELSPIELPCQCSDAGEQASLPRGHLGKESSANQQGF